MSLLKSLSAARKKLLDYAVAQGAADRVAGYERLAKNLKLSGDLLKAARLQCEALRDAGAWVAAPGDSPKKLTDTVAAVLARLNAVTDAVPEVTPDEWRALDDSTNSIREAARARYAKLLDELRADPLPVIYTLLEAAAGFPKLRLTRVREIDAILAALPEAPPNKAKTLTEAAAIKKERDGLMADLAAAVPEKVRGLLTKVAERTATLADLSPDELKWLQDQKLAVGFVVTNAAAPALAAPAGGRR